MRLAIVVTEQHLRTDLLRIVRGAGYQAESLACDPQTLARTSARVILIDVTGPTELATIEALRVASPERKIIALGADPGAMLATVARRAGADEFLRKPFGIEDLERALGSVTDRAPRQLGDEFLTTDATMQKMLGEIDRAAATEATILLRGESGTGQGPARSTDPPSQSETCGSPGRRGMLGTQRPPRRERTLRTSRRCIQRCFEAANRSSRRGVRRHAGPRRSRRTGATPPAEAASRVAGAGNHSARRERFSIRRPPADCHESERPRRGSPTRSLPR